MGPSGISGWLILPVVELVLTAFLFLHFIVLYTTEPESAAQASRIFSQYPAIPFAVLGYALAALAALLMKWRFARPMMFVWYGAIIAVCAWRLAWPALGDGARAVAPEAVIPPLIYAAVLFSYFVISRRVRNTLVR